MRFHFRFMANRRLFMCMSGLLLLLTIVSLLVRGLNFGIDFRGGVVMQITTQQATTTAAVQSVLVAQGVGAGSSVVELGGDPHSFQFKTTPISDAKAKQVFAAMQGKFGAQTKQESLNEVSPTIGRQLRTHAILAVLLATCLMTAYLGIRFQLGEVGAYSGLKFALAAVIALLHDITLTVGVFSVFHLEVNSPFVAAVLTVYGYSMNDTIIVFDRIRERIGLRRRERLSALIDVSVNQVLNRTVTTVATVILALLAVISLGGGSTRNLAVALLVGVCFGTYSSIFVASPIFLWLAGEESTERGPARGRAAPARS